MKLIRAILYYCSGPACFLLVAVVPAIIGSCDHHPPEPPRPEPPRPICCDIERSFQQILVARTTGNSMHCDGWCHWCGIITYQGGMQLTHPCHQGQCGVINENNARCACMRPVVTVEAERK